MRRLYKYMSMLIIIMGATMISGCGKDKLVLVTTEKNSNIDTGSSTDTDSSKQSLPDNMPATATSAEEDVVIEEPSEEESKISIEQIFNANVGDNILKDGVSYSLNTIYYANDIEVYSEFQFLGFDSDGNYLQVYEDSDGYLQLLDNANSCWYIFDNNTLSTLIYPEPGVAEAIIEYNHKNMLFAAEDKTDGEEQITDIYRADGELTVDIKYKDEDGEYLYKYVIDDELKIKAFTCYGSDGTKISYSWVTSGALYDIPEVIMEARALEFNRSVTVAFPKGDGVECTYNIPMAYPLEIRMIEYQAFSDKECSIPWSEIDPMDNGFYEDETIYMKK